MFLFLINTKEFLMEWTLIFIAILGLVILTRAKTLLNVDEGELAELYFQYPCDSTEVTLQHEHKAPFYRAGHPKPVTLAPYPVHRMTIENTNRTDNCSLRLTFNPVELTDAGTYSCQPYKNGSVFSECAGIGLNVDTFPGKVSCEFIEEHTYETNDWGTLSCTASSGSLPGHIECYQNGETVPPKTTLVETNDTLQQIIWVRSNSNTVFCCSTTSDHRADRCQCKDYAWDPSSDTNSSIIIDPCSVVPSKPLTNSTLSTTQANKSSIECHRSYWLVIGLVIVILILFVRLVFYFRAFHNQNRLNNNPVNLNTKLQETKLVMESDECSQLDDEM